MVRRLSRAVALTTLAAAGCGSVSAQIPMPPMGMAGGSMPKAQGVPGMPPSGVNIPPPSKGMPTQGRGIGVQPLGAPNQPSLPQNPNQMGIGADGQVGVAPLPGAGGPGQQPDLNQLLQAAIQDPALDEICPGKKRKDAQVGAECWARVWTVWGCKPENVPQFSEWHQSQSLEILVVDALQWAHLPDERHKQGCHGNWGAPQNQPAPPQQMGMMQGMPPLGMPGQNSMGAPQGMPQGIGMPQQGGMPMGMPPQAQGMPQGINQMQQQVPIPQAQALPGKTMFPPSGGAALQLPTGLGMPGLNAAPGGGAPSPLLQQQQMQQQQMMQQQQQQQAPMDPKIQQWVERILMEGANPQNPLCGSQIQPSTTGVGEECWKKMWGFAGCTTVPPPFMTWHNSQSFEILLWDVAQWATLPTEKHRMTCYGRTEL